VLSIASNTPRVPGRTKSTSRLLVCPSVPRPHLKRFKDLEVFVTGVEGLVGSGG
jgi:hypothetical protein